MRGRTYAVSRKLTEEFGVSGSASASIKRHPNDPLRLPRKCLAPGAYVEHASAGLPLANLALALYEEGLITEADPDWGLAELVKLGLMRLTEGTLGDLVFVAPVDLAVSSTLEGCEGFSVEESDPVPQTYWLALELTNALEPCFAGKRLLELEKAVPGLGKTALDVAQSAGARTTGCWSPLFVRDLSSYIYWRGAGTQEEWLEELEASGEDPDDYGFSPKQYEEGFEVDWACSAQMELDGFALVQALDHPDPAVGDVVEKLCELMCLLNNRRSAFPDASPTDRESVYRGCLIRWDENDPIEQVIDDHIEYANQGADCYTTLCSVWDVKITREDFSEWLKSYRLGLQLYKSLDQLLAMLHTSVKEE